MTRNCQVYSVSHKKSEMFDTNWLHVKENWLLATKLLYYTICLNYGLKEFSEQLHVENELCQNQTVFLCTLLHLGEDFTYTLKQRIVEISLEKKKIVT